MYIDEAAVFCPHPVSRLPQVTVSFGSNNYCAVPDTWGEISLITRSALNAIREHTQTIGGRRYVGDIVGFSCEITAINETVTQREMAYIFREFEI